LYPVRFHVVPTSNGEGGYIAACPITGSEIGNGNIASYLIVRTKSKDKKKNGDTDEVDKNPNVLSERAVKEMGMEGLQAEYGPFEDKDMIRLAPPTAGGVFDEIRSKWEARVEIEALAKVSPNTRRYLESAPVQLFRSHMLGFVSKRRRTRNGRDLLVTGTMPRSRPRWRHPACRLQSVTDPRTARGGKEATRARRGQLSTRRGRRYNPRCLGVLSFQTFLAQGRRSPKQRKKRQTLCSREIAEAGLNSIRLCNPVHARDIASICNGVFSCIRMHLSIYWSLDTLIFCSR